MNLAIECVTSNNDNNVAVYLLNVESVCGAHDLRAMQSFQSRITVARVMAWVAFEARVGLVGHGVYSKCSEADALI